MKIKRILAEWEDGKVYELKEPDVTEFLRAGENKAIHMYLILSFALNLAGGFIWKEVGKIV